MNKYLITGGTGFIGANIVRRLLKEGEAVHLLVRKDYRDWRIKDIKDRLGIHVADLRDREAVESMVGTIKPNIIFHLAAYGAYSFQTDTDRMFQTNIIGTKNLVDACLKGGFSAFVNTGSSSEYGFKSKKTKESDCLEPNSYYAVAKAAATHYCCYVAKTYKVPIATFRLYAVYGPYEEPTRLIPTVIRHALKGQEIKMVSPDTGRDFVYIDDVVNAYLCLDKLRGQYGEIFNIGTGVQSTVYDVVSMVEGITQKKIDAKWNETPPRIWDTNIWVANVKKSQDVLKWRAKNNLRNGLSTTVDWFRKNKDIIP